MRSIRTGWRLGPVVPRMPCLTPGNGIYKKRPSVSPRATSQAWGHGQAAPLTPNIIKGLPEKASRTRPKAGRAIFLSCVRSCLEQAADDERFHALGIVHRVGNDRGL